MPAVGEIWSVSFAFEDDPQQTKNRPALIVGVDGISCTCVLLAISSRTPKPNFDYPIKLWREAGLSRASCVRLENAIQFIHSDLICRVGVLQPEDFDGVCFKLAELYENEDDLYK